MEELIREMLKIKISKFRGVKAMKLDREVEMDSKYNSFSLQIDDSYGSNKGLSDNEEVCLPRRIGRGGEVRLKPVRSIMERRQRQEDKELELSNLRKHKRSSGKVKDDEMTTRRSRDLNRQRRHESDSRVSENSICLEGLENRYQRSGSDISEPRGRHKNTESKYDREKPKKRLKSSVRKPDVRVRKGRSKQAFHDIRRGSSGRGNGDDNG